MTRKIIMSEELGSSVLAGEKYQEKHTFRELHLCTYIERYVSLVDPTDKDISTIDCSITREAEANVTVRLHLHFKQYIRLFDCPLQQIVFIQIHRMVPYLISMALRNENCRQNQHFHFCQQFGVRHEPLCGCHSYEKFILTRRAQVNIRQPNGENFCDVCWGWWDIN